MSMEPEERQEAAALYRRYYAAMKRCALRYVTCPEDAEDVVSTCWVSLLQHVPKLQSMAEGVRGAYILRSVRNRACDLLRQRQRRTTLPLREELAGAEARDPAAIAEWHDALDCLLQGLPEVQRQVVLLRLDGLPPREIALETHLSVERVRGCWRRAVKRLRQRP